MMERTERHSALFISLEKDNIEMIDLLDTLGYDVKMSFFQNLDYPDSRTYIGKGKMDTIKDYLDKYNDIDMVAVNGILKPNQHYNLERYLKKTVFDRVRVILEIFMKRAHSKESKLQIELAKYQYEYPFVREWVHKSKYGEHPGFMSSGGYQTDQYLEFIRKRTNKIKKELDVINKQHLVRIQERQKTGIFTVSIVGYTNVGKSSLINAITSAQTVVENGLFTTLDTLTRKLNNNIGKIQIILTDTIGLIKDTPPWMIFSFKSTLDEVRNSNCILMMLDASESPATITEKYDISNDILREPNNIRSEDDIIIILNKIDKINEEDLNYKMELLSARTQSPIIPISVLNKTGLNRLTNQLITKANHKGK